MLNRQRKQLFTSAVTVMSECLGKEFVFQGHELGAWFWAQCVKSHEKSLKHLKCFGKLGWILKIKCICQPKQEAACFGQVSKIGKDWYSLNDDSYCIWLTADIDAHVLNFQVLMNNGLCGPTVIRDKLLSTLSHILKEASQSDISLLHCSGTWVLVNRTIMNKLFLLVNSLQPCNYCRSVLFFLFYSL